MDECLECHEADDTDYGIKNNKYIANMKNGKTYLHFYEGIMSNSVELKIIRKFLKVLDL